jgi:hypothetical protein
MAHIIMADPSKEQSVGSWHLQFFVKTWVTGLWFVKNVGFCQFYSNVIKIFIYFLSL